MKTVRQVAILDIIEKQEIETQEELASALNARGIRRRPYPATLRNCGC